jgi:hypothetical protein
MGRLEEMKRFLCGLMSGLLLIGGYVAARDYVPSYRGDFDFGLFNVTKNFRWRAPAYCTPMVWSGPWTSALEAQHRTHIAFHERCIVEAASRDAEAARLQILAEGESERSRLVSEYEALITRERLKER